MAPSIQNLSDYLTDYNRRWVDESGTSEALSWSGSQLLAVFCYVIKFCSNPTNEALSNKIRDLDSFASDSMLRAKTEVTQKFSEMVASLMPGLERFFMVPKLPNSTLQANELVASFISFLIQIQDCETHFTNIPVEENRIATLQQELKFLVTILGDMPMMCLDLREVNDLMRKFEDVANQAGSLIFSTYFGHGSCYDQAAAAGSMNERLSDLLRKIEFLNDEIKEHVIKISELPNGMLPYAVIDSLFIVDSLIDDLEDLKTTKVDLDDDFKGHIRILYEDLAALRSFFKDIKAANPTEIQESKQEEKQISKIRDLAYEAEYLIGSYAVGDIPVWYLNLRFPAVVKKVKLIRIGTEETRKSFDIGVAKDSRAVESSEDRKKPTVDDIVVGFEDVAKEIMDVLKGIPRNLQNVFITGTPGLGKTTLAKMLYSDPSTVSYFDKRAWCAVSQAYRRRNLLIDILTCLAVELDKETISRMEDDDLGIKIYQTLKGRRYLVVMDDVWDPLVWDDLRRYFPDDVQGSRVLFTSRHETVAPPGSSIHKPPFLSHDLCWKLLTHKAFRGGPCPPHLEGVGKRIAKQCNGLPFAVVITAGILANLDRTEKAWEKLGASFESYIHDDKDCMNLLELSYQHLPEYLKPCLLYFGAFPEDAEIPTWKLISLWIAEGFISKDDKKRSETIAQKYFMDLIDRSLVLVSRRGNSSGVIACRIHDLLRDLCLRKARDENFLKLIPGHSLMYERHHRLCAYASSSPPLSRPFGLHLRSYLGHLGDLFFCFRSMKLLRVLDLSTRMLKHREEERIGLLVNLRYLALGWIPSSIGSCVKLEFLRVESSTVVTIPSALLQLLKLRYLHIETQAEFDGDCCCLTDTNNLQTLCFVRIYKVEDEEILRYSPYLRKLKCMCEPSLVDRVSGPVRCPDLSFLSQLESLKMEFQSCLRGDYRVINFPRSIKKISLSKAGLPWKKMSIIGRLPNLEVLKLASDAFEGQRWQTRNGEFQKLKLLKLDRLKFSRWNVASRDHFPKLERLVLFKCYHLLKIPSEIGEVDALQIIEVHSCGVYVRNSATKIKEEQLKYGNEEFEVIITGDVW